MTFGQRVREWRRRRLLTQKDLAEQLGVSTMTVQRWELGQGLPNVASQRRIVQVLGVTPDELYAALQEHNGEQASKMVA